MAKQRKNLTTSNSKVGSKVGNNKKQLQKRIHDDELNKTISAISIAVRRRKLSKKKQDRPGGSAKWKKDVTTSKYKARKNYDNKKQQQQKKRIDADLNKTIASIAMALKRKKQKRSRSGASSSSRQWSYLTDLVLQSLPPVFIIYLPSSPDSFIMHTIPEPGRFISQPLPTTAGKFWAGFSHCHLIVLDNLTHQRPSLVNPVLATTVELPESPLAFSRATLTDYPSSPGCCLVGWGGGAKGYVLYCRLDAEGWFVVPCDVSNIIPLGGDDFVVVRSSGMTLARWVLFPEPAMAELMALPPVPLFDPLMVQFGGQLWAFSFPRWVKNADEWVWFEAYRHDLATRAWVKVSDRKLLEGRVLLVSNGGQSRVVQTPTSWGGQGNCIYFRELRCGRLVRLWLEDLKLEFILESVVPATDSPPFKGSREIGWFCSTSSDEY